MEDLRTLLDDAEKAQQQTLRALADDREEVAHLKDPVLLLLHVLNQSENVEGRQETLQVLQRLFAVCSAHFYDSQAFLEAAADAKPTLPTAKHSDKRGNALLKGLLTSLSALSSQDEVDEQAVQTLVEMVRDLCLQSMNAADVVALFDFLRLGRPPARRRVLKILKLLMEMDTLPRAIFTMRGAHAGLIVPTEQPLFSKRGYSFSIGVHLEANTVYVPLYSFRGQNGQGVSAALKGEALLVKMHAPQGVMQQVEVPFVEYRTLMEQTWIHLCIVHAKKMVFKDKVTIFVDGKAVFNGNLGYPDPMVMTNGQNSIGIEPLVDGLNGKVWSPTLFGVVLTEAEVQKLHWLTHWKNDLNSVAAENVGLADKSKFCFCYDARSCDLESRVCYDVSGNDCHGSLGPGTNAYVTQSFVHALDSVGGCSCFILLLLDQIPEMADFHPVHEFEMGEISDLLGFVGAGLHHSTMCRSHFARLQGVKVVEFILQAISPSYLSVDLLDGVVSILEAMTDFLEGNGDVVEYIYRLLFFNTSWFLSPFETQVKLLSDVLPKYLSLLQKSGQRERSNSVDMTPNSSGKTAASRTLSLAEFPRSLTAKDRVDVSFFCRLISQVYMLHADKEAFTVESMNAVHLEQLRGLLIQNLIDLLLFPLSSDVATDQWRQLLAYILQQCDGNSARYSTDRDSEAVDVEEMFHYLAHNLASTEPRKVPGNVPTRQAQLTTNIFKLSKGTVRVLWRPMQSTYANVRLAALQLFELYTSDKVLLHKNDMLMLYSSFQAHTLTSNVADLLLDIVIGRKRSQANSKASSGVAETRTGNLARMAFIPMVLLGLIHNANFDVQARVLTEIRFQLASPTIGESVKETIRSWPSWMSRLRSISVAASVAVTQANTGPSSMRERSLTQTENLNEACILLSGDATPIFEKLEAIQVIADSGDVSGCDFALSVLQNSTQSETVSNAIISMVINVFPQRCCALVRKLVNQMIVDIVVYCVLRVRNGWMHFLEFYFFHWRSPSDYCNLVAVICEQIVQQAGQKNALPQTDIMWENVCQVAAVVSQSSLVARKMSEILSINDAALSPGQWRIIVRKAFELWQIVLPHLKRINWDSQAAHLVQNGDYATGLTAEETAIFFNLVASRPRSSFLALQNTLEHVSLAQAENANDAELMQRFLSTLEILRLIVPVPAPSVSTASGSTTSSTPPLSGVMSPPLSGSVFPDRAFILPLDGITESSSFLETDYDTSQPPERELVHMYTLDTCFTLLNSCLDSAGVDVIRVIVNIMVALANTALHLRDDNASPELTKTLQIISSTDLSFFSDVTQYRELLMLWQLHLQMHQSCCDQNVLHGFTERLNAEFICRWAYVAEHHTMEFNPYLVQQYASSQAEVLEEELQQCEHLWKEIIDESETTTAQVNEAEIEHESRLVELKHSTEKFASSVHKLLIRSTQERPSSPESDQTSSLDINQQPEEQGGFEGDGVVFKIDSSENGFRMRLRLKKATEDYRIRNLSCEQTGSSFPDNESKESGKKLGRKLRGSIEGGLADLESSWRSDTGSDYSDFLADAQMRAAIIRSLSNAEGYDNTYDGFSDDDIDDVSFYDTAISSPPVKSLEQKVEDKLLVPHDATELEQSTVGSCSEQSNEPAPSNPMESPCLSVDDAPSSSSSLPPTSTLKPSSPLSTFSLGSSVLTVVGGVAEYFQKSVKDAKDAVEFGVDSMYTTKDAVTEEAQALVQEVSNYIEHTNTSSQIRSEMTPQSMEHLELTPSSLKMMEATLSSSGHSSDKMDDSVPELFPKSEIRVSETIHDTTAKRQIDPQCNLQVNAQLVRHLHVVEGKLVLSQSSLRFVAERVIDEHETVVVEKKPGEQVGKTWRFLFKRRRWGIDDIASIYRRRYLLKPTALELFIRSTRKNYFFNLASEDVVRFHEALMAHRPLLLKRDPAVRRLRHPSSLFRNSSMSTRWVQHDISTFEYLMWVNTIAGRTYNDLTQYPVFPWIISDYESATLDLTRRGAYRDLTKPIGALEPNRLKFFVDRYNAFEDPDIPKFMYGTHYSNIGSVLYYLIRLEPFTSYALNVQGGKFDHADRLFHSVAETWSNCLTDYTDLKELTPEWFYLPNLLVNCNKLDLGTRQNGTTVDHVVLPPWARSPEDFVMKNLVALESEYVSANIHHWIDLVFGWKQRGTAAVEANNVFFYLTYEGMVDVDSITDPVVKSSMQSQIAHFGQTPTQVLREPHPQRQALGNYVKPTPLFPAVADACCTPLNVPHEGPIVKVGLVPGTAQLVCVDCNGMLSTHRFGPKTSKSESAAKSPAFKPKPTTTNSSSGTEQPSEFIELQDRKCRKVIGDKRLLSEKFISNVVALIHGGMVLCTVGHHDFSARFHSTTDGTLLYRLLQHQSVVTCVNASNTGTMLALGCQDGTISVWKVAIISSTLLDSLKIFRGSKVNSRPVDSNDYSADQVLLGHDARINCVSVSDELGVCISGSASNECLMHDLADGSILHAFNVPGNLEPGVISLAVSNVGHVLLQSMGTGVPMLYSFHLNGTLLAELSLGDRPMNICISARYSKVVASNSERAIVLTAHTLDDERVLLDKSTCGEISAQGLAPDEMHVVLGVGSGKIVSLSLLQPQPPLQRTEI